MTQASFRTYQRRQATRASGYHTCDETTGGECIIKFAQEYITNTNTINFTFFRRSLRLVELFQKGISILAFGGYIHSTSPITIKISIAYSYENNIVKCEKQLKSITANTWTSIGIHKEQTINNQPYISSVTITMNIESSPGTILNFISFDFDIIKKSEFLDDSCSESFYQKTAVTIPYLYYLNSMLPFDIYLQSSHTLMQGRRVVLKSCNRCGRYLPINIEDELKTLSFSLHCKKKAPCKHALFNAYEIKNYAEIKDHLSDLNIDGEKIISYYGHQLECKACKKFFVNAPLNPQRNSQQHREDGLRRRAIEILVNTLLERNLIHFEFEKKTKKEFSQYIWEKFDRRCFKCGPTSAHISLDEMALDHTMPLAYLYRLDETATCLCHSHNSQKSDNFPIDFYDEDELERLRGCPACFLILKGVVISSHETNRFS